MTSEQFATILTGLREQLATGNLSLPDMPTNLDLGQLEIWKRIESSLSVLDDMHTTHCEICKYEFDESIEHNLRIIDAYLTGGLTEPTRVWSITYRSVDGRHGYTELFKSERAPAVDGYEIANIGSGVLFKEEYESSKIKE